MSRASSTESLKHPYQRAEAWVHGIKRNPPLSDSFRNCADGTMERIAKMIENWERSEWTKRPDNWRKLNGYPE